MWRSDSLGPGVSDFHADVTRHLAKATQRDLFWLVSSGDTVQALPTEPRGSLWFIVNIWFFVCFFLGYRFQVH